MTLAEALAHVKSGGRAVSNALPVGAVLKLSEGWEPRVRVVFELTGNGYDFHPRAEHEVADWRKVEGWVNYEQ